MIIASILQEILVFFPVTLGVHLSYAVLRIPDLTVDGSFVLGAAVCARLIHVGAPASVAMGAAFVAGVLAGVLTAWIQRGGRISPLLAGILSVFILQSVNLQVMGRPNLSLLEYATLSTWLTRSFSTWNPWTAPIGLAVLVGIVSAGYAAVLRSRTGLWLRAAGCQPAGARLMGQDPQRLRLLGLALSNGLVGLAGALTAQHSGYADVNMGMGLVLLGIATVIIAQQLIAATFGNRPAPAGAQVALCFVGAGAYFTTVHLFVLGGVPPHWLKLAIGLGLIAFLRTQRTRQLGKSS
ncbi:MAG: ABC transporter permease [Myxococcota bacterium]